MSKLLANEIANYGDNAPIDLKEGLNIPAGKPIQAAGVAGSSGMVLTSTGTSISWTIPFDGNYNTLTNKPTIPAAQVNSDWNASGGVAVILNKPTVPPLTSLTVNPAGTPALSFNAANGEFTYTPPDLSNYDTAYGWGDHAQAGYLTAEVDTIQDVVQRSYYDRPWFGGTISNSWSPGGKPVFDSTTFTNEIYHHGFGDSIHIGSNTAGVRWLDYDVAGDSVDAGKNPGKIIGYNYYISDELVNSFRGGGTVANGINQLANVLHHDVQPDVDGNATTYSIGNDAGIIRLGNRSGTSPYLEASSTATKLFHNGSEKLTTTTTGIDLGSNELVTTGKILYSNNYANTGDLPSATTYHGMFAHVHAEGHGYMAHGGAWLQLLDEGSSIDELANVDTSTNADGYVLKWEASSSSWKPAPDLVGTSTAGITLADLSVSTAAAGSAALSYSNTTGVFTYTPPDLSGYLTTETDPVFSASPAAGILSSNIANWDSAYGWGDHGAAGYATETWVNNKGYLTSYTESDTLSTVTGRGATTTNALTVGGLSIGDDTDGTKTKSLKLGDDDDLILFYDGRVGYVTSYIESDQMIIRPKTTPSDTYIDMIEGGPVRLYHGSNTRISTSAIGAVISGTLTAGGLTYPTTNGNAGEVLTSDGTGNVSWSAVSGGGGGGGANVTISDTIPAGTPTAGDLWWESDKGRLKVYYTDTNSSQWVDVNPPLKPSLSSDAPVTASSAGTVGDIRYDSSYVYICIATDTWKRAAIATW